MGGELKSFHDQIRAVFLLFASVLVLRRVKAIYNVMSSISLGADMQCQEAEWEGKALFLKNTEWLLYAEALQRESRLGSWVGLPWKFVPYSLQVTNSWKSFTHIISSYCCACGYFLYSLRAFHWKRHQRFLASGNKYFEAPAAKTCTKGSKRAHLLQDALGLCGCHWTSEDTPLSQTSLLPALKLPAQEPVSHSSIDALRKVLGGWGSALFFLMVRI